MNAKSLLVNCALVAAIGWCIPAWSAPQAGWWWNPAESGRGFFVESDGGITFIGAYVYGADGHADWLVTGGPNPDPYNYTGQLFSMRNGQTLFGGYVPPVGPTYAGTLTVHFTDDTHGIVTWPGGTTPIERQVFGGTDALFQPASGWWWNPKESGSGYSIEVQGDNLFFVGFTYDDAGRPVWYFSAGSMNTLTTYTGSLLQFANGQTVGGPYHPPGTPAVVGNVEIDFDSRDKGTITFTRPTATARSAQSAPKTSGSESRSTPVQTQFPRPSSEISLKYMGQFLVTQEYPENGWQYKTTWSGDLLFEPYPCSSPSLVGCYRGTVGSVIVNSVGELMQPPVTCRSQGVGVSRRRAPEVAELVIDDLGFWRLTLSLRSTTSNSTTCTNSTNGQSSTLSGFEIPAVFVRSFTDQRIQNALPVNYQAGAFTEIEDRAGAFYYIFNGAGLGGIINEAGYVRFQPSN